LNIYEKPGAHLDAAVRAEKVTERREAADHRGVVAPGERAPAGPDQHVGTEGKCEFATSSATCEPYFSPPLHSNPSEWTLLGIIEM
jgi:hypothetical protein